MTNVANLSAKLSLDASQFVSGWREATAAMQEHDKKVKARAAGKSIVEHLPALGDMDVKFDRFKQANEQMAHAADAAKRAAEVEKRIQEAAMADKLSRFKAGNEMMAHAADATSRQMAVAAAADAAAMNAKFARFQAGNQMMAHSADFEARQKSQLAQATARLTVLTNEETAALRRSIAARQAAAFAMDDTGRALGLAHGRTQRLNMATMQLGFAIEDASVSYGTGGFAGAVRGATNNVAAMALMLGPQAALMTTLAAAGLNLGLSFSRMGEDAKKAALESEAFKRQIERIKELAESFGQGKEFEIKLNGILDAGGAKSLEAGTQEALDANQAKIEGMKKQEADFRALREREENAIRGKIADAERRAFGIRVEKVALGLLGDTFQQQEAGIQHAIELRKQESDSAKELKKLEEERIRLQKEFNDAKQKAVDIAFREAEAEDRAAAQKEKENALQERNKQADDVAKDLEKRNEDAQKGLKRAADDILAELDRVASKVKKITEDAQGRFQAISDALELGQITEEQAAILDRANEQARIAQLKELKESLEKSRKFEAVKGVGAFTQGSKEAFSLIQSQLRGSIETTPKKQLAELEEINVILAQIRDKPEPGLDDFIVANF